MDPLTISLIGTAANVAARTDIAKKLYEDLASPAFKKVGIVFETIFDTANGFIESLKYYTDKRKLISATNLKKLQQQLEPVLEVIPAPPEIAAPAMERLTYVSNDDLSNIYVNLLASAANRATANIAHPGFLAVLDRLSPDEAKILNFLKDNTGIPRMQLHLRDIDNPGQVKFLAIDYTGLHNWITFDHPEHEGLYVENLTSLGILLPMEYRLHDNSSNIDSLYNQVVLDMKKRFMDQRKPEHTEEFHEALEKSQLQGFVVTDFGKLLIKACVR